MISSPLVPRSSDDARRANPSGAARTARPIVTGDGVELFQRSWGDGSPLLFVHSWALSSVIWRQQLPFFAEHGFRSTCFDRRGHGRSDVPASGYDLDRLADDLNDVLEAEGSSRVALIGHSMGCGEIIRYIGRYGTNRVSKIIFLAPTTPFLIQTDDNPYGAPASYFEDTRAEMQKDFPGWIEANKLAAFTPETSPATMDWLAREMARADLPVILACNKSFTATDLRPDLEKIDRPVLILHGDKDASAPLEITGRRTAAGIRGATLKVYEGAPHLLFLTHAEEVNADMLEFLSD